MPWKAFFFLFKSKVRGLQYKNKERRPKSHSEHDFLLAKYVSIFLQGQNCSVHSMGNQNCLPHTFGPVMFCPVGQAVAPVGMGRDSDWNHSSGESCSSIFLIKIRISSIPFLKVTGNQVIAAISSLVFSPGKLRFKSSLTDQELRLRNRFVTIEKTTIEVRWTLNPSWALTPICGLSGSINMN